MKTKQRRQVFNLVIFAIFSAIILLLSLVPYLGFITIGPVSITIVHIPVLIGVMIMPLGYAAGLGAVFGLGSFIASFIYGSGPIDLAFQNPLVSILPRVLFAVVASLIFYGFRQVQKTKYGDAIIFGVISVITNIFFLYGGLALANTINAENQLLKNILVPVFVGIGGILIALYYFFIDNKKLRNTIAIPSTIMLSTLFHTVIVLLSVGIFKSSALDQLGTGVMELIKLVVGSNGLIEIIAGVVIATPISIALINAFPEHIKLDINLKKEENKNDITIWCWKYKY